MTSDSGRHTTKMALFFFPFHFALHSFRYVTLYTLYICFSFASLSGNFRNGALFCLLMSETQRAWYSQVETISLLFLFIVSCNQLVIMNRLVRSRLYYRSLTKYSFPN